MLQVVIRRNRRWALKTSEQLLKLVTPRTNAALISPAENLCGALALQTSAPGGGPTALEIVADQERTRFVLRAGSKGQQDQVRGQVAAAYPQATLRSLDGHRFQVAIRYASAPTSRSRATACTSV